MPFESCSKRFVTDLVKLNVFLLIKGVEIKENLRKKLFRVRNLVTVSLFTSDSRCKQKIQNSYQLKQIHRQTNPNQVA